MTKAEAEAVRVKGKQQGASPAYEHLNKELEGSEGSYLTGNYHCTDCDEPVAKKPNRVISPQVPARSTAHSPQTGY